MTPLRAADKLQLYIRFITIIHAVSVAIAGRLISLPVLISSTTVSLIEES